MACIDLCSHREGATGSARPTNPPIATCTVVLGGVVGLLMSKPGNLVGSRGRGPSALRPWLAFTQRRQTYPVHSADRETATSLYSTVTMKSTKRNPTSHTDLMRANPQFLRGLWFLSDQRETVADTQATLTSTNTPSWFYRRTTSLFLFLSLSFSLSLVLSLYLSLSSMNGASPIHTRQHPPTNAPPPPAAKKE